jgi:hypothetical protein
MTLFTSKILQGKETLSLLKSPVLWLLRLLRNPKCGEYYPVTGLNPPSRDKMVVGRSFRTPVRLYALGEDYQLVVVDHSPDYREAEFRVRCEVLDHEVAVAKWMPWSKNPNCLFLEMTFFQTVETYTMVFRKARN